MKFENGIFEETYVTSFSQTGVHKVLTNKSLLSLMENIAGAHSAYCNFTFKDLAKDNLSWIIVSWKLKVFKRPKADETIKIQTWGREHNRLFVIRDFKILNNQDEVCAIASSKWCLVDTLKRKIAKLPDNIEEIYHGFRHESVFESDDFDEETQKSFNKYLKSEEPPIASDKYRIRRFDIDINKHVHNLNYINFAYELLPFDVFIGNELNNLEIMYKKEIKYGETIKSFLYHIDDLYIIITRSEDEKILHSIVYLY